MIADTIAPWVLGTLLLITFILLLSSAKAWRDVKRSPYFFLRRQAEKRLQTYATTSMVLLLLTGGIGAYAWRAPTEASPRTAVLANAKPPQEEIVAMLERRVAAAPLPVAAEEVTSVTTVDLLRLDEAAAAAPQQLPAEYDRYEPTVDLLPDTALGEIQFSTEINDDFEAQDPGLIFPEGNFTLYATFSYEDMADGMVWSWVWRRNGQVVDGGNQVWEYGSDGPGYIFFGPEEGFQAGEYALEVWVNGEMLTGSTAIMNSAAALSAGN